NVVGSMEIPPGEVKAMLSFKDSLQSAHAVHAIPDEGRLDKAAARSAVGIADHNGAVRGRRPSSAGAVTREEPERNHSRRLGPAKGMCQAPSGIALARKHPGIRRNVAGAALEAAPRKVTKTDETLALSPQNGFAASRRVGQPTGGPT